MRASHHSWKSEVLMIISLMLFIGLLSSQVSITGHTILDDGTLYDESNIMLSGSWITINDTIYEGDSSIVSNTIVSGLCGCSANRNPEIGDTSISVVSEAPPPFNWGDKIEL